MRAVITGVHGWLPDDKLTNADLEAMVNTNDEWIRSRTGIAERRILKGELGTSEIGYHAVMGLLQKTKVNPEDIDLLICATITPDMQFPACANLIAYRTGLVNAFNYDMGAACSSFLYALVTGQQFIQTGMYKKVIVVGADKMSSIIDYTDRRTCIIFGDGGGAVLLEPSDDPNVGIIDSWLRSDGNGSNYLHQWIGGSARPLTLDNINDRRHFVYQDGATVYKAAVKGMAQAAREILQRNNLQVTDIDWLIPHQANERIISSVGDDLGVPTEKIIKNITYYGNTTSGTLPLAMWDGEQQFKKGDKIILVTFGGGYTWGATYLRWGYDTPKTS
jgi:3-oxoacyl-[acyl-carrier-protein] synthase-3